MLIEDMFSPHTNQIEVIRTMTRMRMRTRTRETQTRIMNLKILEISGIISSDIKIRGKFVRH